MNKKVDNIIGFLNTAIQKDWQSVEAKPVKKAIALIILRGETIRKKIMIIWKMDYWGGK